MVVTRAAQPHKKLSSRKQKLSRAYALSKKIKQLEKWVQGSLQPDLTLLFDVPVEISMTRLSTAREPDKFEREDAQFFEKLRQAYLTRASENPTRFRIVDANQALDKVKVLVEKIIANL